MIKVSFIAPTSLIPSYGNRGDFHLALAHLIGPVNEEPNAYQQALVESRLPIILDNGLFENQKSVPVEELMEKAIRLRATHVFAPDVLYDRKATEENVGFAFQMLEKLKTRHPRCETKLAAVVQADNVYDFVSSYQTMVDDSRIDLIGLSILSVPHSFKGTSGTDDITANRIECLEMLNRLPEHKSSHLLGLGSSYADVDYARRNCDWVVSHDSSSAVWNGVHGKRISPSTFKVDGGKTPIHVDFNFNSPPDESQVANIDHNIAVVKLIAR